jgi:hypothetical protein
MPVNPLNDALRPARHVRNSNCLRALNRLSPRAVRLSKRKCGLRCPVEAGHWAPSSLLRPSPSRAGVKTDLAAEQCVFIATESRAERRGEECNAASHERATSIPRTSGWRDASAGRAGRQGWGARRPAPAGELASATATAKGPHGSAPVAPRLPHGARSRASMTPPAAASVGGFVRFDLEGLLGPWAGRPLLGTASRE